MYITNDNDQDAAIKVTVKRRLPNNPDVALYQFLVGPRSAMTIPHRFHFGAAEGSIVIHSTGPASIC